jgi:hypothetical protein
MVTIQSQLDRQLARWSYEHGERLSIPELAERLEGISPDFLYRFRAIDLTQGEQTGEYVMGRLDLWKTQQLLDFFGCTLDELLLAREDDGR